MVFDILKAVEHQLAERELEADDYIEVIHALDIEMPTQKEIENISFKMHRLLSDLTTQEANSEDAEMAMGCWPGSAQPPRITRRRWHRD